MTGRRGRKKGYPGRAVGRVDVAQQDPLSLLRQRRNNTATQQEDTNNDNGNNDPETHECTSLTSDVDDNDTRNVDDITVERLHKKIVQLEKKIERSNSIPPTSAVGVEKISIPSLSSRSSFGHSEGVLLKSLSSYSKTEIYPRMNFCSLDGGFAKRICMAAVKAGQVNLPTNMSLQQFANYFEKKVPAVFTKLRKSSESNVTKVLSRKSNLHLNIYFCLRTNHLLVDAFQNRQVPVGFPDCVRVSYTVAAGTEARKF